MTQLVPITETKWNTKNTMRKINKARSIIIETILHAYGPWVLALTNCVLEYSELPLTSAHQCGCERAMREQRMVNLDQFINRHSGEIYEYKDLPVIQLRTAEMERLQDDEHELDDDGIYSFDGEMDEADDVRAGKNETNDGEYIKCTLLTFQD